MLQGRDFQACLTSGQQLTLRDVANHHSASDLDRKSEGAAGGTVTQALLTSEGRLCPLMEVPLSLMVQVQGGWAWDLRCEEGPLRRKRPAHPHLQPGACRSAAFPKHSMNF